MAAFIYFITAHNAEQYDSAIEELYQEGCITVKIGWAVNVDSRLLTLQTGSHFKLGILTRKGYMNKDDAKAAEKQYKLKYKDQKIRGEWFRLMREDIEVILTDDNEENEEEEDEDEEDIDE